jgi:hypothetical protein
MPLANEEKDAEQAKYECLLQPTTSEFLGSAID